MKLPQSVLDKEQTIKLSSFITEKLEQETRSTQPDRKPSDRSLMHSLKKVINRKGPFDYIVDGLNVAYGGNCKFRFDKVDI